MIARFLVFALALIAATASAQTTPATPAIMYPSSAGHDLGYTTTPILPGLKWHVHDIDRPHPPQVTPANTAAGAPSDAIVLFDGHSLDKWHDQPGAYQKPSDTRGPAQWKVADGYTEVVPKAGNIATNETFGDIQLHVEWASPTVITGNAQARGNSGIILDGFYEVQVLDAWNNPTYADGQAGAIYGQWPPLANPARPPGEWNTYDIIFDAPRWQGDMLVKPGYVTVLMNGLLMQDHQQILGVTEHMRLPHDAPHGDMPLVLQNHHDPVRFRNIWIRRIPHNDALEPNPFNAASTK